MAPDWNFDGRRFLVRSILVRNKTFVQEKGPFPNSAFGTVIPTHSPWPAGVGGPRNPKSLNLPYTSPFHCLSVRLIWSSLDYSTTFNHWIGQNTTTNTFMSHRWYLGESCTLKIMENCMNNLYSLKQNRELFRVNIYPFQISWVCLHRSSTKDIVVKHLSAEIMVYWRMLEAGIYDPW